MRTEIRESCTSSQPTPELLLRSCVDLEDTILKMADNGVRKIGERVGANRM
jgi:hypothetical protein